MYLPISDILIKRMMSLGRIATLDEETRILVPYPDDIFLVDHIGKLLGHDKNVSLQPRGKYDLILCYRPLLFNQEQDTAIEYYSHLKTNGRLICTALDASLEVKKDTQKKFSIWLKNIDAMMDSLPGFEQDKTYRGKLLVIDRLEYVAKEDPGIQKVRILRTDKYKNKYHETH